jgi:acetyltransferase-like isoleucine patch superfamily enzyme
MEGGVEIRNIASVRFGSVVSLGKGVLIDGLSRDGVCLGDGVSIGRHSILRCTGTLSNMGVGISIGDGTGMDAFCFVGGAGGVYIGKNVLVGQHASFHAEDHCFEDLEKLIKEQGTTRRGIYIGDNCWIGANVTFLDGCTVGSGSIVGAGSIVRGSLPDNCIAVGVPARVVRSR